VLGVVLATMRGTDDASCLDPVVSPATVLLWPSALSFGDGKLSYAGDPRFDEMAPLPARAKLGRSVTLRMPAQATQSGLRVVKNSKDVPSCRGRIALHSPLFYGDFAVVATSEQVQDMVGGEMQIQVLRFRDGHWQPYAFGISRWGRPII